MWLAIDTALSACSAALLDGERVVAERHVLIGRGHAERLVPLVAELLDETGSPKVEAVVADVGPGSFTGLRVGIAAARAFALAWGAASHGCSSTALVAAGAFAADVGVDRLHVVLEAGHGELYVQGYARDGLAPLDALQALSPEAARAVALASGVIAGSGAERLAAMGDFRVVDHPWPLAAEMRLLPEAARRLPLAPLYVRAPDARLPA